MNNKTDIVRKMYTKYPYPYPDDTKGGLDDIAIYFKFFERENNVNYRNARILDAGCGTGHRTIEIAKAYPKAEIIGIDMTENSLNIARKQAEELNLSNIKFYEQNLLEPINLEKFDVIVSTGVIHHLENPKRGLTNLMSVLKDDGMILLWLYGYIGEFDRMMNRELVKTLMKNSTDFEDGMNIIEQLRLKVKSDRYGNSYANNEITQKVQQSIDADALIHEIVNFYRVDDIIDLFKGENRKYFFLDGITLQKQDTLRAVLDDSAYNDDEMKYTNINEFLTEELISRYLSLSNIERCRILELLYKPVGYTVLGWHKRPELGERINNGIIEIDL